MVAPKVSVPDEFLARLTDAAYRVALKHGFQGPFIDVELDLWRELAVVVREELAAEVTPPPAAGGCNGRDSWPEWATRPLRERLFRDEVKAWRA